MATSITFTPPQHDPRERLYHILEKAPKEHTEALLDAYEILQLLRDKGILELVKGLLGSGEKVLGILTRTITNEEAISLFRNLFILAKLLGGVNPELLEKVETALSESINGAKKGSPPGLVALFGRISSRDSRRFLTTLANVMETVGRNLAQAEEPGLRGEKREMITRRKVDRVPNNPRAD